MAILTIRTAGLGFGPTPMGAPQPRASDLRQTPSSGGGMSKGMSIPRTITPPGFTPRTFTPKRTNSSYDPSFGAQAAKTKNADPTGNPLKDAGPAGSGGGSGDGNGAAVETADDFIAETTEANVGQDSQDAQDVIKTDEVITPDGGDELLRDGRGGPRFVQPTAPAGMSTGKKVAIGVGVGLAALALFSIFR
jgi:hypothetical protein